MRTDRIYELRTSKGLSMAELGEKIGTSASTIYKWEHGKTTSLKVTWLAPLAKALDTTVEYLMGYVDDPHEKLQPSTYSEEEMELIKIYRKLDLKGRYSLLQAAWSIESGHLSAMLPEEIQAEKEKRKNEKPGKSFTLLPSGEILVDGKVVGNLK